MKGNAFRNMVGLGLIFLGAVAIQFTGCASTTGRAPSPAEEIQPQETLPVSRGGAQLWAENCMRCHNMRSPSSYSDAEWEVAMAHMRVRGNLTAEETRVILEFLKAGN